MNATVTPAPSSDPTASATRFTPVRRRRFRDRRHSVPLPATPRSISVISWSLIVVVSLTLVLLACVFIVTGLTVWVSNGASEWTAALVPAVLAALLFFLAVRIARATGNTR